MIMARRLIVRSLFLLFHRIHIQLSGLEPSMSRTRILHSFRSLAQPQKQNDHLGWQQRPALHPRGHQGQIEPRVKTGTINIGIIGERHKGGESAVRWQANPSHCLVIRENYGPGGKAISADELENVELLFGHDAGEWAPMQYQTKPS